MEFSNRGETSLWMPKTTALHRYLNLAVLQVPHVKRTTLWFQHILCWLGHKTLRFSWFHRLSSAVLTRGLIFRQVEKISHLNMGLIFTHLQLIGNHHWEGSCKPRDLVSRLLHRAEWRKLGKQSCVSPCGKPGSSTLPTNMTNVVIVKEGWLHKRGKCTDKVWFNINCVEFLISDCFKCNCSNCAWNQSKIRWSLYALRYLCVMVCLFVWIFSQFI